VRSGIAAAAARNKGPAAVADLGAVDFLERTDTACTPDTVEQSAMGWGACRGSWRA
jgi:hypothetical protein